MRALVFLAALLAGPALAQHAHHGVANPYATLETRPVKILSEQQVADLKAGRGMSLALPAELNGYPGPTHVLELADGLDLSAAQRERTTALIAAMRNEAIPLGEDIIARETALDRLFAWRKAQAAASQRQVAELGQRQAELRYAHLKYHLAVPEVLTPEQVARYQTLRGYTH